MNPGTSYYRTRQHIVPQEVPQVTIRRVNAGGVVATNYRAWRQATSWATLDTQSMIVRETGLARVELLSFQMALGIAGVGSPEDTRFSDLVATGFVQVEEAEAVLLGWCDDGVIPEGFRRAGEARAH